MDFKYSGKIPEGFDVISLPEAEYSLDQYDPTIIGYEWDNSNPRIQLEARGERGYIVLKAIKKKVHQ